ncbi:MAG: hypothetical protein ACLQIQ_07440, partial [Beijerinckiaceae bacterium]
VAHIPTAEAEEARSSLNFEGQEQARLHLKSKPPWSYEWGPLQIALPSLITKNKRTHTFPYGSMVATILERIPRTSEYVFPASRSNVRGKPTTSFNGWPKCKEAFDAKCRIAASQRTTG